MSPGEQSAGCIDRKSSSQPGHAVFDQFRTITRSTEAEVFIDANLSRSDRVMDFGKINITGVYACHLIRLHCCPPGRWLHRAVVTSSRDQHRGIHSRTLETFIASELLAHDECCSCPVAQRRTHEHRQGAY